MAGPDFPYHHRRGARRRKTARSRGRFGSTLWLAPLMAVAFLAALAGFQRLPGGDTADAPSMIELPFVRGDVAGPAVDTARATGAADALSARFGFCHSGGGRNCVVDGDSFWFAGDKYRIADIDTPETHPARCAEEARLGDAATGRLRKWLNAGAFSLESAGRDVDQYDRKLRIVTRGGTSVGSVLVAEGLARPWEGRRRPWC